MGFKLTHLQYFILFLVVYTLTTTTTAFARVNVTISYLDPSITYSPPGAWSQSVPSKLDLGGAHMLTQVPNATASFNFTGKFSSRLYLFSFFSILLFFSFKSGWFLFFPLFLFHLSRHRDILFSSIVALSRHYCCITRFWAYLSNQFNGSR